ncbi:cystathionine gamma-synthase [Lactobacillus delbrueckii subsp. bulgaricus]|nr:cystathionine gamma-synthase [Lactobacillus delbrueckii subsp. bulgaricus]
MVIHSATKYLGGHNDILGGVVVVKDPVLADFYFQYTITVGDTMSALDSWLLNRSLKTLPLRMQQHTASAKKIVSFLEQAPHVEKVLYPGKAGMISFYLDSDEEVDRVLKSVKLITFAESLGGAESLLTIPHYQTHDDVAEDKRLRLGITPRLLRLSVVLENADDLIADLAQALGE